MRIAAIGTAVPSLRIDNEAVLERIAAHNPHLTASQLRTTQRAASDLLHACGSDVRYYRDRERGEASREIIGSAVARALATANLSPPELDLVVYCGVSRPFVEPGNAYFVAAEVGARCDCYDISDACMGWMRSMQVVQDGMQVGRYRNALVVSAEFGIYELFDSCFNLKGPLDLRHSIAAYTLGEAACATVVVADGPPWSFHYRSRPDLADLCFFPLPGFEGFVARTERLASARPLEFVAHSGELFAATEVELRALLQEVVPDIDAPRIYIPHAASSVAYQAAAERSGLPSGRLFAEVMPRFGNVASASLPFGLALAEREGRLGQDDDVVLCPASAGVSVGVARLRWQANGVGHVAC